MAAGLGFKNFVSGDVLTAADTNGYLMQGVWVFANAAARTAAVTSPQQGNVSFLKDTNNLEIYNGTTWVGYGSGDITGVTTAANSGLTGGVTSGDANLRINTTAKGSIVVGTGATTLGELTVGANNTVLTADSTTATGLKWASASSGPTGWTLLNAGGTALTGAQDITISGISAKEILVLVIGASSASTDSVFSVRPNNISAADYTNVGINNTINSTYSTGNFQPTGAYSASSGIVIGQMGSNAASTVSGAVHIDLANTTGWKRVTAVGSGDNSGATAGFRQLTTLGFWEGSAAITSITVNSLLGNFDAGTVYVMGAN